jgi:hypothetical protein
MISRILRGSTCRCQAEPHHVTAKSVLCTFAPLVLHTLHSTQCFPQSASALH